MEQQEQINAALREDVDSIKTTMGKLLELFQNLVTKENTPQPPGSTERPELSLPKGYTPPEEGDPNHTPIIIPVTNGDPPPRGVSMLKEASSQPHHATKGMEGSAGSRSMAVNTHPDVEPAQICDYHAGSPGHNIEDCRAFKYKVQELIDRKLLSFKEEADS
ncbi:unnamed protein product [Trifolium pratense]|uniref:Uncharacterized protein n=1 Tax=Trifolium pratense TaxID=57577 RepID=A0ACB0LSC0_TRIPR|nr:unnamed protein product [Trifolium pratense]